MSRTPVIIAAVLAMAARVEPAGAAGSSAQPNIIWIVAEDMGPELGCYGDKNAITPNMDRLAREGVRFNRCFTHAPVCAPSRSGLITGRYPTSIGTHHMRSTLLKPPPMFTSYLQRAGYRICWPTATRTGAGKTDFNFDVPVGAFDVVSDWTKKIPDEPFFAFLNIMTSHESRIRATPEEMAKYLERVPISKRHDPAAMRVPAYHPDTPIVRREVANYYDLVTAVDYEVGDVLDALDRAGVADRTVVVVTGDHGRGLPRIKQWVYDQGIHVPLIVRWPAEMAHGSVRDDLVCFLDLPATMLALAGVPVPHEFQGQVILGPKTAPPRKYVFSARDRMDERYDRIRSVRGVRFHYIRNFEPGLPYAQWISYSELMQTMQEWRRLHVQGRLNAIQEAFFAPTKPVEELYDTVDDPDEVHNLAGTGDRQDTLRETRAALEHWIAETHDLGAVPETELIRRGLVADRLTEYEPRKRNAPPESKP